MLPEPSKKSAPGGRKGRDGGESRAQVFKKPVNDLDSDPSPQRDEPRFVGCTIHCRFAGILLFLGVAPHMRQIAWARYMVPMMVNEAMPDATRILMTVSGSGQR